MARGTLNIGKTSVVGSMRFRHDLIERWGFGPTPAVNIIVINESMEPTLLHGRKFLVDRPKTLLGHRIDVNPFDGRADRPAYGREDDGD